MNALRNIFSGRALNLVRQNGQNALINITQPVDNASISANSLSNGTNALIPNRPTEPLVIPKSIVEATKFTGKNLLNKSNSTGSISPATLKLYSRIQRKVDITYICKLCNTRNTKQVNEAAYKNGVVILQCDGCSINHLIIDNLGWFINNKNKSFEEILAQNSNRIKIIKVNQDGMLPSIFKELIELTLLPANAELEIMIKI
uniref:DNL-type domain-containing protein n=1 Tax=Glossina brevipalpis TaxID=37001 RepID=A0A1A9WX02_9MUSC